MGGPARGILLGTVTWMRAGFHPGHGTDLFGAKSRELEVTVTLRQAITVDAPVRRALPPPGLKLGPPEGLR